MPATSNVIPAPPCSGAMNTGSDIARRPSPQVTNLSVKWSDSADGAGELYGLKIGDHAISEQIVPCWNCRYCKSGAYWMCNVHDIYGFRQRTFGSWADYMLFPAGALNYKVPAFHSVTSCRVH